MNIGIIGLGYVGMTLAVAAADSGITVYGKETSQHIKDCLKNNKAHFFEPGINEIIEKVNGKTFFCVENFPTRPKLDAFIITVGTPLEKGAKSPNFEYIKTALASLEDAYDGSQLVILRSTVSVGTTRKTVIPYLASKSGKTDEELLVAMCPERTVEGKAVEELRTLPQVIGGNNAKSVEIAKEIFSKITHHIIEVDSLEEAELVKLYCNVYRDTMFAVGNVFCVAAQEFGVDGTKVIKAANEGYPRSKIALPGFVAGPCLEKDAYLLTNNMPDCKAKDFIKAERSFNEYMEDIVVEWVKKYSKNKIIAMSGMAFKGRPETSDLRGSSSVYIAQKLYKLGYELHLHDFAAFDFEMESLGVGRVCKTIEEACESADLLLVLNNHPNYSGLIPCDAMKNGFRVLDCWDVCEKLKGKVIRNTLGDAVIKEKLQ